MNKLQIIQKINELSGVQGSIDSAESTVGYQTTAVLMLDKAYKDIQTFREDWDFMRTTTELNLSTVVNTLTDVDIKEVLMIRYEYSRMKQYNYDTEYLLKDQEPFTGKPTRFYVNPYNRMIIFNPLDADYTVDIDYYRAPDVMTMNESIPIIPAEHHYALVYKALMNIGSFFGNGDLINEYSVHYSIEMGQLMRNQLPQLVIVTEPFA